MTTMTPPPPPSKTPPRPRLVPGLYPLLTDPLVGLDDFPRAARALADAGVLTLQLRVKADIGDGRRLALQRAVTAALADWPGLLVINDRADLAALLRHEAPPTIAVGLHLGQDDLPPAHARAIVGPDVVIGLSTHSPDQVRAAAAEPVDYLGYGPIFPTRTKANPDPVVGLAGLAAAASLTSLPLVAIGGVDLATAPACRDAGAHAVAVSGALFAGDLANLTGRAHALVRASAAGSVAERPQP